MLVLSRKVGERVWIGNGVCVTVVGVHGKQIRLGIEADGSIPIRREELMPIRQPFDLSPSFEERSGQDWYSCEWQKNGELVEV